MFGARSQSGLFTVVHKLHLYSLCCMATMSFYLMQGFCQNCGYEMPESARFCPHCGHASRGSTAHNPQRITSSPSEGVKVGFFALIGCFGLVVLVLLSPLLLFFFVGILLSFALTFAVGFAVTFALVGTTIRDHPLGFVVLGIRDHPPGYVVLGFVVFAALVCAAAFGLWRAYKRYRGTRVRG